MRLAKWQGLGNDYLVINESELPGELTVPAIRALCDRHLGVGSDGILLNCSPSGAVEGAVARMRVFNPDGSEPEMCGNGVRIFARYLWSQGLVKQREFTVETLAGAVQPSLIGEDRVRVHMGSARFRSTNIATAATGDVIDSVLEAGGSEYRFTFVDVGNPHCIIQVDDPAEVDACRVGSLIERHPLFPNKVNVEFIAVDADGSVRMRVWERGVGETQACGTGATAVGAACVRLGLAQSPVNVHLPGGTLIIEAECDAGGCDVGALQVHMSGPAEEVFSAELSADLMPSLGWS